MQNQEIHIISIITTGIIGLFIIIIYLLLFQYKKKSQRVDSKISDLKHKYEKDILSVQLEIQEDTLKRISKEIHDNISLNLTLAKLYLNTTLLDNQNNMQEACIDLISKALVDLNDLSKSIDGDLIERYGLKQAIEKEMNNMSKIGTINFKYEFKGSQIFLDWKTELMAFRIIQESLRNAITHSYCKNINLEVVYFEKFACIAITDDGKGFDTSILTSHNNKKISSGLKNIQNRSQMINGELNISSTINGGTKVKLIIPY